MIMVWQAISGLAIEHGRLAQRRERESDELLLEKRLRVGFKSHAKLVDLIEAKDGAGAETHWRAHMIAAGKVWLDMVGASSLVDLLS